MMVMCQVSVRCMSNLNLSLTLVDVKLVVTAALRTELLHSHINGIQEKSQHIRLELVN